MSMAETGTWTGLEFAPLVGTEWMIALAVLSVLALAPALLKRARGAAARALFLLAALIVLANPLLVEEERELLPDQALVIVDRSASQTVGDRRPQINSALDAIRGSYEGAADLELRVIEIGVEQREQGGTRLLGPLAEALAEIPKEQFAGAILLTDGLVHDSAAAARIGALTGPVHLLLSGDRQLRDRRLIIEKAPEFALVERPAELIVRVEDSDRRGENRRARLVVRQDGQVVFDRMVRVGIPWPIALMADKRGPMLVEIEAEPLEAEATLKNNRSLLRINALRDRLRVLLISGEPHPGERVWRAALKSDPAVDLIHFTILRLPTSQDATPVSELALIPFPTDELFDVQLDRFDLVIFDRYTLRGVLVMRYLSNLTNYVMNGGAILVSMGPESLSKFNLSNTPLGAILPAVPTGEILEGGFRPKLTNLGRRHPVTSGLPGKGSGAAEASWGRWFRAVETRLQGGDVLMTGPGGTPLLVLSRAGEGRVAQLLSDQVWMWARGVDGGGPHQAILRRTLHWLMKEPDLEEEALILESDGRLLTAERRSLTMDGGSITIIAPDGTEQTLELTPQGDGSSRGSVEIDAPGLYRARDGDREVLAVAGALNPKEFAQIVPTAERLAPLAERTGGRTLWLADGIPDFRRVPGAADAGGRNWVGLKRREATRTLSLAQTAMISDWFAVIALLVLALLAWWRESR